MASAEPPFQLVVLTSMPLERPWQWIGTRWPSGSESSATLAGCWSLSP
jgi:hypothetical protein